MRHQRQKSAQYFFTTAPLPCPYLPERMERRVVTELVGRDVVSLHDALSLTGFRRSHSVAYAPACSDCQACIPIRINCQKFKPSKTQARIERVNSDLSWQVCEPIATEEQYNLFMAYQNGRHSDGEMSRMDFEDYQALVEDTPIESLVYEFRNSEGVLKTVCLADQICNGLSAVYSFYDPLLTRNSLGTFMVVWLVRQALEMGLGYVYLGFWVKACSKMSYKSSFQPVEIFHEGHWIASDGNTPPGRE
ncbi:MAG: arginyltransferase [Rhodospirillales bacterium]|nr:arginyltransferase [Rhodospirillales bacterium]